jgi:geranylgeranyl diphosphate synthase type I
MLTERGKLVDDFLLRMLKLDTSDELCEIVQHQVKASGKRIRPALTFLSCEAVGGEAEAAIPVATAIELAHNYTLIFDDIIDHSDLRRGLPTVRAKYDDVMAILTGMHYREAIFEATKRSPKRIKVEEIISKALRSIIEGERLDVLFEQAGRDSEYIGKMMYKSVGEQDYFRMIGNKTAMLLEAACKVGALVGNGLPKQVDALSEFGWNCGLAFQIVDDILDMSGKKEEFGKDIGKDIKEHKLGNLVLLYSLEELPEVDRKRLLQILRSPIVGEVELDEATRLILSTNATKRAHEAALDYVTHAETALDAFPPTEEKDALLSLADFIAKRNL